MAHTRSVLVLGDQRMADWLTAALPNDWTVWPAVENSDALWDGIEAETLPSDAAALVVATSSANDTNLEATVGEFARCTRVLVYADRTAGEQIVDGAARYIAEEGSIIPKENFVVVPAGEPSAANIALEAILSTQTSETTAVSSADTAANETQDNAQESDTPAVVNTAKSSDALPEQVTIAVMSSKGGSGKSTTAFSLAATIARTSAAAGEPKKVVLVDLDVRDGQVGSLLGQYMPTAINIRVKPVWDANTVQEALVYDQELGFEALLAPVQPRNANDVGPEFYQHIIQVLQTTHDVVILDCSVNYLDPLLNVAFTLSDQILFVTSLASTSVQGMARSLTEMFADPSEGGLGVPRDKIGVVANQVIRNVGMGKDKLLKAALGVPLVGQIPSDQDAVLVATNTNRMGDLLKHPGLGPAYFQLAQHCLPDWNLAPVHASMQPAPSGSDNGKKKGLFRR
jgi:Mrp family chromosome partitioning ATPase